MIRQYESIFSHVLISISSLCNLCVLCVSVVNYAETYFTTETQRTQRLHRETQTKTLPHFFVPFVAKLLRVSESVIEPDGEVCARGRSRGWRGGVGETVVRLL